MSQSVLNFLSRPEVWASASALIGFLTLTWVIRGAPIGQAMRDEPAEAPPSSYRDRVIVSAVVGLLLVLVGGVVAGTKGIPWSLPVFATGFGLLIGVMKFNRKFRHDSESIRRVYEFAGTSLTASLIAGILIVGNVVAFRYGGRAIDLTRDHAYSLSSRTLAQLQTLDRPISFVAYFGNSERSVRQGQLMGNLLQLYKRANPSKVDVTYLDSSLDMKEFETLVKRVPQIETSQEGGIVLTFGEGDGAPQTLISLPELFATKGNPPASSRDRIMTSFSGEDALTSALVRLREGIRSKIAFTTGHGESSPGEIDTNGPGLGLWRSRLATVGLDVVETDLLREDVPDMVNLVVICGPRRPFQPDEIDRLKAFIIRDGKLLILLGNAEPTGLDEFLRTYNVEVGKGQAVDPRYNVQGRPTWVYAPVPPNSNQPIVDSLTGRWVLFPDAAPLTTLGGPPKAGVAPSLKSSNPGVVATPFLRTGPDSWVETSLGTNPVERDPRNDIAGPVNVGVSVIVSPARAADPPKPRMVVFSSPAVAENLVTRRVPANLDLLMNSIQWLRGRPSAIGIDARTHESLIFAADTGLKTRLVMIPTLLAILVIVGLGVTTYVARRD